MPLRISTPDAGFTAAQRPVAKEPPASPGFWDTLPTVAAMMNPGTLGPTLAQNAPAIGAAFRMENAVVNAWEYLSKPTFAPDETFDVKKQLEADNLWDGYRDNFLETQSREEYDYHKNKIVRENADRSTLQRAGAAGLVFSMAAGVADPTSLLPFVGAGKGALAVLKAAALGGVAAGLQEIPLQLNQETRTAEESALSVAGGTVLGAILGGGAVYLRRRAGQTVSGALDEYAAGMAQTDGGPAIPTSRVLEAEQGINAITARQRDELSKLDPADEQAQAATALRHDAELADAHARLEEANAEQARFSAEAEMDDILATSFGKGAGVGADVIASTDAGGLKGMLGIGEKLTRIAGPVTSVLGQQVSKIGRQIMAQLSTAGLRLEKNLVLNKKGEIIGSIPSNQGGTIESIVNSRRAEGLAVLNKSHANYADYVFGQAKGPKTLRNTRAAIAGMVERRVSTGPNARMNKREFMEAVGRAMLNGDESPVPEVAATAKEHRAFYDRLLAEAQELGIIPEEINLLGDISFLNRLYDTDAIARNPNRFMELLSEHMEAALQEDLAKVWAGYSKSQARDALRLADMDLPLAQATALRKQYADELKALDSAEDDDFGPIEEVITSFHSEAAKRAKDINKLNRELSVTGLDRKTRADKNAQITKLTAERDAFREEVDNLKNLGGADLEARAARRAELKFRMRTLNKNQYLVEEKYRKKFNEIEDLEEKNIETMHRAIGAGQRALKEMDSISDKSADSIERAAKSLDAVVDQWVNLGNRIEALKAKPANADMSIENPDFEVVKLMGLEAKQDTVLERLTAAQENLRSIQNIDRTEGGVAEARGAVQEALDATVEKLSLLNDRRAKRAAKLEKSAEKFDKKAWQAKRDEIAARTTTRRQDTEEKLRLMGADKLDMEKGTANFSERAKEIAQSAKDKIMGTNLRLAGFDAMADARGTELARTLSIPSEKLTPYGFIRTDAEQALHAYANTLLPDIELVRRLGPFAPEGNIPMWARDLNEEKTAVLKAFQDAAEAKAAKSGKPFNVEDIGEDLKKIEQEYVTIRRNLDAVIARLRHTWGLPKDPGSMGNRAAAVVLQAQALRLLGGVVFSSFSDFSRPVMKYGLNRTMQKAWLPMISNWKAIKMTMKEAQQAFVAIETLTTDRAHQLADLMVGARKSSGAEAALEWGTSKIGIVAVFSPWTDVMKTLSTMAFNSKMLDSLELALEGTGNAAARKEAVEFLASLGWSEELQARVWKEIQSGGGEKIGGTWVPQTDKWVSKDAVRAFRAATYAESSASVITPGVELPKIANAGTVNRLIFNLKSFAMASTSKTTMAALQQRDMAVLNGLWISLALGGLSVYVKAQLGGEEAVKRMMGWSPNEWVNRSLDASGIMGAVSLATQLLDDSTAGLATGTTMPQQGLKAIREALGANQINNPASAIIGDVLGPTADLGSLLAQTIASGKWTPAEIHRIRSLLPLQNVFYLRKRFDVLENSVGGDR